MSKIKAIKKKLSDHPKFYRKIMLTLVTLFSISGIATVFFWKFGLQGLSIRYLYALGAIAAISMLLFLLLAEDKAPYRNGGRRSDD